MKVTLISLHFSQYVIGLARALVQHHEVLLILNRNNFDDEVGDDQIFDGLNGLTVYYLPHTRNPFAVLPRARELVRIIRAFGSDIIHCQEDTKDYLAVALPFLDRIPFVLTVHDPKPHTGLDAKRRRRSRHGFYGRQLRLRADMVIVHGDRLIPIAEEVIPQLLGRVFSIPHGPLFNQQPNFDWQPGNCLFFGRIEAYKGLPYFIEAIRILRREGIPVTGVIAGRGTELDRLKTGLLHDSGFIIKDRYLSPAEVRDCFLQANVVVLPYVDATQSGVAACALGIGRPMIATKVGGLPDMVRDGKSGVLVPPKDSAAVAAAIRLVVEKPKLARSMAKSALELAAGELSWREIALKTSQVYEQAIRFSVSHVRRW